MSTTLIYHCPECGYTEEIDIDEEGSSECPECGCDWECEWDTVECGDCGSDNMEWDDVGWHCLDCGSHPDEVHFYLDDDDD